MNRILFGQWGQAAVEDVVACRLDDRTLEIHCHGGERAVARILHDWRSLDAEVADWKSLLVETGDVLHAELQDCLSRAITWRTTEFLLHQMNGVLRAAFERLHGVEWTPAARALAGEQVERLLNWSEFGLHLTQPWRVVLTGRPNAGKSSLINALLGYQRSIVFDQPGTTRDAVMAMTALDGWPVQLTDTAGIRSSADALEAEGIARAHQQIAAADLVLRLVDISEPPGEKEILTNSPRISREILVAHKCDLPDQWGSALPADATRVSSITGIGMDQLQQEIVRLLVPVVPDATCALPITPRQTSLLIAMKDSLADGDEAAYRKAAAAAIQPVGSPKR